MVFHTDREHFISPMESIVKLTLIIILNLSEHIRMVIEMKELLLGKMGIHLLEVIKIIKNGMEKSIIKKIMKQ